MKTIDFQTIQASIITGDETGLLIYSILQSFSRMVLFTTRLTDY